VLAKFREFQHVLVEDKGVRYQVKSEITSSHPEVHEGVVINVDTTITAEGPDKCRVITSCKLRFPRSNVSKVIIDSLYDIVDTAFHELAENIRQNFIVVEKITPPLTPSPSSGSLAAAHPFNLDPKLLIVAGLGLLIFLFVLWWTSASPPALSEEEKRFLVFLQKSRAGTLEPLDTISALLERYKSAVLTAGRQGVEDQLASLQDRVGRFKVI